MYAILKIEDNGIFTKVFQSDDWHEVLTEWSGFTDQKLLGVDVRYTLVWMIFNTLDIGETP